jgi:hypothetical protein
MTATMLVLVALLGGPQQIQLLQTTLGPDEARIKVFNETIERGVNELYPKLCGSVQGYTLETGAGGVTFPTHAAVYFARFYREADRISWNIPMTGQDPAAAAKDVLYNLRVALSAAEHCGGVSKLCPAAFTGIDTCAGQQATVAHR